MQINEAQMTAIKAAFAEYRHNRRSFKTMAQHVHDAIRDKCDPAYIHTIEYRAKSPESFYDKATKVEDDDLKYKDPLNEITDLAGVRVIVFVRDFVDPVCDAISEMFEVKEREDVGERVYKQGRFGYQSIHIIVKLDKKIYLGGLPEVSEALCEVQVRTILQHAWAEMEHDIQYKGNQIPTELAKRFSALAGLLEIADGEFQRIQHDSRMLRDAVQANLLDDLTQQGLDKSSEAEPESDAANEVRRVRALISQMKYHDAVKLYGEKIRIEPNNHSLYIGRAKVLFLLGEADRALADLSVAEKIAPTDPVIAITRDLIEKGDLENLKEQGKGVGTLNLGRISSGFEALKNGNGVQAFDDFAYLEAHGYPKPFAIFNKAMACALEGDFKGARAFLTTLKIIPGTPMSVNIIALQLILDVLEGESIEEDSVQLDQALALVPNFSFSQSLLRRLLEGLKCRGSPSLGRIAEVLAPLGPDADVSTGD